MWLGVVALALTFGVAPRSAEPTAVELAAAVQKKYDSIRDFSSEFVHTYRGGVLRKELTESGRLLVKKPGKMRWEYTAPEEKLFVSDGVKIYSYIPRDKQVLVTTVQKDPEPSTPAEFLTGTGDLVRDFTASLVQPRANATPGVRSLKLVPKAPQPDYDWLIVEVDPKTLTLRGLVSTDPQGGESTISFTNLKENVGLSDKPFTFQIPRGVDVVTDSPTR